MITGKDIHVAAEQVSLPAGHAISDWDSISDISRSLYTQVAQKLNRAHVEPLQTLVSDMQIFIEELCAWPDTPSMNEIVLELRERAKGLLPKKGTRL